MGPAASGAVAAASDGIRLAGRKDSAGELQAGSKAKGEAGGDEAGMVAIRCVWAGGDVVGKVAIRCGMGLCISGF